MIEDQAQKQILKDNYEQYRVKADAYRERGDAEKAAKLYRKCAETLEDIANAESSDRLATKRHELAENLRTAAERLEGAGSLDGQQPGTGADAPDGPLRSDTPPNSTPSASGKSSDGRNNGSRPSGVSSATPDTETDASGFLEEPPEMAFEDVGGMGELKETLRDTVIDPLERPDLYEEYDLGVVNAILLYGPPGTGKTYITNALAGELGYNFIEIGATDITSSLVGEAADNVAELFEVARSNQPCLIFVDEIDALMPSRSGGSQKTQSERQMVNQFLTELTETRGEDVIVVGATNLPEEVDDAAVSRFQERIEVPPPDAPARAAILRVHFRNRPVLHEEIDWETTKGQTAGYSARDLEIVATNAARYALEDARESDDVQPITQSHLERAIEETEATLTGYER
ncbi:ATP-binding protein [Halapricum desulfuricans]|uniref:ATPase of the AAA+ class, CDC48 family n=1 Tax=Halapricum desulfuricans TaxID=2841257 RepID=A0A897N261_9EURY|nr:ATP-binding protein [Halapricum desulfuricans]QSG08480.1 ATPase of the AAA+ class, CDC48 family [Halapricum desulfuricans]